ncbi:MAG: saccharopine dehydrogenase [Chloroflexi bacterium]|nr:MAG: saccharopine dehydrogenase [Chloroflexota bacterium]
MNITVLGAGLVGSAIVKDLARDPNFAVTAADINPQALRRLQTEAPITTAPANLQDPHTVAQVVSSADLVVCAVPGFMGFETVKTVIEAGKNLVDISFFPEDAFALDELAQQRGVTAVVDCGVAPGLCNIMAGHAETQLDSVERYLCYVGGLPKIRSWPYEYKAVFSPADVLEEYTRPARFVEYGRPVTRPALSDVELVELPGVGTLEAFNTDGLRSLMRTLDAPFMKEKTLRYPGHANLMRVFRESGFFNPEPVAVNGQNVTPLELTSQLLFDQWKLQPDEVDFTVMRVVVEGQRNGQILRTTFDLYDEYDPATATHSMARTTGYTATIVARQVAGGLFTKKGICPPEFVGRTPGCFENLLEEYERRNIQVRQTTAVLGN